MTQEVNGFAVRHRGARSPDTPIHTRVTAKWYVRGLAGQRLAIFSRIQTIGMGGLFISATDPPPVGTTIRLAFDVPGGSVRADAVVRDIIPGEGLGVEFTRMDVGGNSCCKS